MLLTPILALTLASVPQDAAAAQSPIVVLASDQRFKLAGATVHDGHLRIPLQRIEAITGFTRKAEGLCTSTICIPTEKSWFGGKGENGWFDLTLFAKAAGMALVAEAEHRAWSLSPANAVLAGGLAAGKAPDFGLPDRKGKTVRLSDFRGKKVLILTWASW